MEKNDSSFKINNVWLRGIIWAILMYSITMVLSPLILGEKMNTSKWHINALVWLAAGLIMAQLVQYFDKKKSKRMED